MKKIIIIFACVLMSLGLCSCKKTKEGTKNKNNTTITTNNKKSTTTVDPNSIGDKVYTELEEYKNGTHIFNVSETDVDFIKNGISDYVILTSSKPGSAIIEASAYFFDLFFEATGISISSVDDTQVNYTDEQKVISIGANLYQEAALSAEIRLL